MRTSKNSKPHLIVNSKRRIIRPLHPLLEVQLQVHLLFHPIRLQRWARFKTVRQLSIIFQEVITMTTGYFVMNLARYFVMTKGILLMILETL